MIGDYTFSKVCQYLLSTVSIIYWIWYVLKFGQDELLGIAPRLGFIRTNFLLLIIGKILTETLDGGTVFTTLGFTLPIAGFVHAYFWDSP